MTVTIPTTTAAPIEDLDPAPVNTTPAGARPTFLAAISAGRYPVLPARLVKAVAALDQAGDLEQDNATATSEGLAGFCQRVAGEVLAGRGYPKDFAAAAHAAVLAGDRQAAAAAALRTIRMQVDTGFPGVVAAVLPELLDGLRAALVEVMAELRAADEALGSLLIADPDAVAGATDAQRAALLSLTGLRGRYNSLRAGQRAALQACPVKPPGTSDLVVGHGWAQVFASGLAEFSDVARRGLPSAHGQPAQRFRALARRADVWLPTVDELAKAWDKLHPRPEVRSAPVQAYNSLLKVSA